MSSCGVSKVVKGIDGRCSNALAQALPACFLHSGSILDMHAIFSSNMSCIAIEAYSSNINHSRLKKCCLQNVHPTYALGASPIQWMKFAVLDKPNPNTPYNHLKSSAFFFRMDWNGSQYAQA